MSGNRLMTFQHTIFRQLMFEALGTQTISPPDQEEVGCFDASDCADCQLQKAGHTGKVQTDHTKNNKKKTHPCKGLDIEFKCVKEGGDDKILLDGAAQQLSDEVLEIKNALLSPTFSIENHDGAIKLVPDKPIAGKVGSPIGYSTIKKILSSDPLVKEFHSQISGYGGITPEGDKTRPKQLLSPEMAEELVDQQNADKGGINTMLATFDDKVLGPIEETFDLLPMLYPSRPGETLSAVFKAYLKVVIDAHFVALPSGLFLMTHLYNIIQKLITEGEPTARNKKILAQATNQVKQKFIPKLLGATEKGRYQTILSYIEKLINRIAKLMRSISFLEAAPKYRVGKFETYWNQDLELTPGALVFRFCLPAPVHPVASNVVPLVSARRSSVELADKTTDADSKMALEDQQSLSGPEDLEDDRHLSTPLLKSLFSLGSSPSPQRSSNLFCSSEENTNSFQSESESFLADDNTAQSFNSLFEAEIFGSDYGCSHSNYQHEEFAESHQRTDFTSN